MAVMRVMVAANGLHGTERNGLRNAPSIVGETVAPLAIGPLASTRVVPYLQRGAVDAGLVELLSRIHVNKFTML